MQAYDPFALQKAVEHFLERLVADYGAELYLALVFISLAVIAGIIARNLRHRDQHRGTLSAPSVLLVPLPAVTAVPPPLTDPRVPDFPFPSPGDDEHTAFCA